MLIQYKTQYSRISRDIIWTGHINEVASVWSFFLDTIPNNIGLYVHIFIYVISIADIILKIIFNTSIIDCVLLIVKKYIYIMFILCLENGLHSNQKFKRLTQLVIVVINGRPHNCNCGRYCRTNCANDDTSVKFCKRFIKPCNWKKNCWPQNKNVFFKMTTWNIESMVAFTLSKV